MNNKRKLFAFSGLAITTASLFLLSGCSIFSSGGDTARLDSLEAQVQANSAQITALQQQVQNLDAKVNAQPVTTAPASTTTTPRTTTTQTGGLTPGSVTYTGLTVTPQDILINQTITISVTVKNNSTSQGDFKVIVAERMKSPFISDTVTEYANTIPLTSGETKTVTFTTTKDLQSVYTLTAGTQTTQYAVNTPVSTVTPTE
jgi:outer membrane murein-binding lipoprotein Lpp